MEWSALFEPPALQLREGRSGVTVPIAAGLTIGRNRKADHVLNDPQVSGIHARVERVAGALVLVDQQSSNGTFVGEQRVTRCLLVPGVRLTLGETLFVVERQT
ncbi:MAG: FHA domain-containing protein [Thermomicrobiales bacterium]